MRVLVVEDELYLAEAVQAGLRLEAIASDIAGDGDSALERLSVNTYDVVVLDRDIPGTHGDDVCRVIVERGWGCRVLMLTAASRLQEKVTGFEMGADDYLTKPFELAELVVRIRSLARRPKTGRPPVLEYAGIRLDPFRREVFRSGPHIRHPETVRCSGGPHDRTGRCGQRGIAAGKRLGRKCGSFHQRGTHHHLHPAQVRATRRRSSRCPVSGTTWTSRTPGDDRRHRPPRSGAFLCRASRAAGGGSGGQRYRTGGLAG